MGKITLTNIAEELAAASGMSKEASDNFIRLFIDTIEKGLLEDSIVKIKGLGTFKLMDMSDRGSVDINTGERITIKGYRKVSFTPDSAMKEFVNRPFAHFEPTELNDGYPAEEEEVPVAEDEVKAEEETVAPVEVSEHADPIAEEPVVAESEPIETAPIVETEEQEVPEVEAQQLEVAEPEDEEKTVEEPVVIVPEQPVAEDPAEVPAVEQKEQDKQKKQLKTKPATAIEETQTNDNASKAKMSKRIFGWLTVILLIVVAYGIYRIVPINQKSLADAHGKEVEEYSEMMVNPNLGEELGDGWSDEPQIHTHATTESKEKASLKSEKTDEPSQPQTPQTSDRSDKTESPKAAATKPATEGKFCSVTLTEALEAKEIKDITPADTTDYVIDGTLITHELKKGETIILLAKKYYGDKRLWPYIVKYNWMKDYNNVAIGQMINIPVLKDKTTL